MMVGLFFWWWMLGEVGMVRALVACSEIVLSKPARPDSSQYFCY